jgi:pyruvate kinase
MLPHPEIIEASDVGHVLLVDDGKVKLQVTGTGPGYIDCVVGTFLRNYVFFGDVTA